jgi:hypothetical protein
MGEIMGKLGKLMEKPSWKSWLIGVTVFASTYLITELVTKGAFHGEMVTRAVAAALAGGTLTWFLWYRKLKRQFALDKSRKGFDPKQVQL